MTEFANCVTVQNYVMSIIIFLNVTSWKQKENIILWNSIKNTTQKYHNLYNVLEHTIILRIAKFCNIILALFK